jgi:TatD DNase family protein
MNFIDFHTHKNFNFEDKNFSIIEIKNIMQTEFFDFKDFWLPQSQATEGGGKNRFFSVGLHPYFLTAQNVAQDIDFLEKMLVHQQILAVGECGLDKLKNLENIDFQIKILEQQIKLAEKQNKPVIIHCVKAFSELLAIQKKMRPKIPLIVHGFDKNEEILQQLIQKNFYISIGASVLRGGKWKNLLTKIPLEKLLLETDDSCLPIQIIYEKVSELLNLTPDFLQEIIFTNYKILFYKKS